MTDCREDALRELVDRAQTIIARARALTDASLREVEAVRQSVSKTWEDRRLEARSAARC